MPTDWLAGNEPPADWDQKLADELVGSLVLVGITYRAPSGEDIRSEQFAAYVRSVDARWGVTFRLKDGEDFNMPPALGAFTPARPGTYTSQTGETVSDPDYLVVWTVTAPKN